MSHSTPTPVPYYPYHLTEEDQYHLYRARHLARVLSLVALTSKDSYVDLDRESLGVTFGLLEELIAAGDPGFRKPQEAMQ